MQYIIFDLEATCWEGWEKQHNETIEIGAVKVDSQRNIIGEFQQFIKPLKHPTLSPFCTELTSITQSDVDNAPYFDQVIAEFKEWCGKEDNHFVLCSWGFYDRKQFESDSSLFGLETDWLENHISLKHQHAKFQKLKRAIGMKNALKHEGIKLDGTHHRGIDDARNIAKIFIKHFNQWDYTNMAGK